MCKNSNSFLIRKKYTMYSRIKLVNDDYFNDLNLIHKFNYYFQKDNYNQVIDELTNNKISKVYINNDYKQLVSIDKLTNLNSIQDDSIYNHYHITNINPAVIPNLIAKTSELHVPIYFADFTPPSIINIQNLLSELFVLATYAIPAYILISIVYAFYRGVNSMPKPNNFNKKGSRSNMMGGFGNSGGMSFFENDDAIDALLVKPNVSLTSWVGSPEVIEECKEIVSYLEKKEIYKEIGAEMPKGILLEGPPGTGKTLLAKAIATETNSTFISMSGSEFVELFVGMGAARVRELFETARDNTPCIIFIDEIDAVARQRGAGINMANDEREQTLNQLLYEMDGFNNNTDIVVLAATNRRDVLDKAILRPGRFDRIIRVPVPDKSSREKILSFYLDSKKLEKPFDISSIAELTDGFSGAELKNLINEAAIISARNNYTVIKENYIFDAFEKSIVGLIRNNASVAPMTKTRVSIHESGHTLLVLKFKEYFDFQKVSIQPTYNGAGGYTIFTEKPEIKEGGLYTRDILKKRLMVTMGGKAAESVIYGNDYVSLGAVEDLRQANKLAQRMIGNFGMGDKLEVFFNEDVSDDSSPFLGKTFGTSDKYSQYTKFISDKESLQLVKEAYAEAKQLLLENKDKLISFSELLKESTVVYKGDIIEDYLL
uniref:AAA+ ATPase domain-containing protein n=1 Tax=viral metagenome TaxID=1070528 RepID=A0A6C0EQ36_9ZZZZ